jgi:Na+/phosphate symporter
VSALEDCRKAADEAYERYETAYDEGSASFDQQIKEWVTAVERNEKSQKNLSNEFCKTLGQVYGQVDDVLRDKVWKAYEDMSKYLEDEARRLIQVKNRIEEYNEQNKKKLDGYFEVYQRRNGIAREKAETYKLIAEMAGLNLRA